MVNKISSETAKILIETKCVDFSLKKKFLLTSGKKSPIYCDCRRLISFPEQRKKIINYAVKKIKMIIRTTTFTILLVVNQLEYLLLHLFLKEWIYHYLI